MRQPGGRVAARAVSSAVPASPCPGASAATLSRQPGRTFGGCWPGRFRRSWCRGPAASPPSARRGNPPRSTPPAAVFTAISGEHSTRRGCGPGFPGGSPSRVRAPRGAAAAGCACPDPATAAAGVPRLLPPCWSAGGVKAEQQATGSWLLRDGEVTAMVQESTDVLFDIAGPVATMTLNRPAKLNAVTPRMTDAIRGHADRINADSGIRVVVLTGAGEKAFCAGSDVTELDAYDTAWEFRGRPDYCDAIRSIRKPVIAAVNGYAYGGGLELAMSADIRLASQTATFAAPEIKLGWIGGGGVSAFLARSAGPSNAALMLYTGDPVNAATALTWGLVSQ